MSKNNIDEIFFLQVINFHATICFFIVFLCFRSPNSSYSCKLYLTDSPLVTIKLGFAGV